MYIRLPRWARRRSIFVAGLVVAFICSFAVPLLLVGKLSGLFSEEWAERLGVKSDETFPKALSVNGANSTLQIEAHPELNPPADKDFLLIGWFKLNRLPADGQMVLLLSKVENYSRVKRGYAVGLQGAGDSVRPAVYWQSSGGEGGWQMFSDVKLKPKQWFMLALSFYSGRYLGVHVIDYADPKNFRIVSGGGYDLQQVPLPRSSGGLELGGFIAQEIRGKLGPFGVFTLRNLDQDLKQLLHKFAEQPLQLPGRFDQANVLLWSVDGRKDLGKFSLKLRVGPQAPSSSTPGKG